MTVFPSGEQHTIERGPQRATVVEVGGGIREYAVGGRPVLEPYPVDAMCDGAHGAPLVPWPNRLQDGAYRFDGVDYQVALTEPERHNAIHGFLRWRSWHVVEHGADRVVVGCRLHPLPGYPFTLDVRVAYSLGEDGLTVRTTAVNLGDRPCPYACGQHPYLSPGEGTIDGCTLHLDAATWIATDQRMLPAGTRPVAGSETDFRSPAVIGDREIDIAFGDLARDADGRAWARLTGRDGRTAELWVDGAYSMIEVFTGDSLAPHRRRRGLGTEPMTCPPNGFRSGEGLLRLAPGDSLTTGWGVRLA